MTLYMTCALVSSDTRPGMPGKSLPWRGAPTVASIGLTSRCHHAHIYLTAVGVPLHYA